MVRYLIAVAVLTIAIVVGLRVWSVAQPAPPTIGLLAIAVPDHVVAGEQVAVFGGLRFPPGRFELGLWSCVTQTCKRHLWKQVDGPGDIWGSLGSLTFSQGPGTVVLRVYRLNDTSDEVLAEWRHEVQVADAISGDGTIRGAYLAQTD